MQDMARAFFDKKNAAALHTGVHSKRCAPSAGQVALTFAVVGQVLHAASTHRSQWNGDSEAMSEQ